MRIFLLALSLSIFSSLVGCDDSSSGGSAAGGSSGASGSSNNAGSGGSAGSSNNAGSGGSSGSGNNAGSGGGSGSGNSAGSGGSAGSGNPPTGDCDANHCRLDDLFTCFQWSSNDPQVVAMQKEICSQYEGTMGEGACPSGMVSGCKTVSGSSCAINWGYAPITDENVKADCTDEGQEFIDR